MTGSAVFDTQFTRDKLGRITRKIETVNGTVVTYDYVYDVAGRLTDVSRNGVNISHYVYDANGNRVTATVNGITSQGFYDLQDRMTKYGNNIYTYTANGELLTKTVNGQTTSYNYDVVGSLLGVTLPGGRVISYVVDGKGRRIGKKINGTLTQGFLYKDRLNPIAELDGVGNVVSRFVYATRPNVPSYMIKGGTTYRIISDNLGSVRLVVDTATGTVIQRMDYDEFGNVTLDTNPGFQPFGYAGGLYDKDTGLVRFGFRDYDSKTCRWTSKDPIRFNGGDTNLYGYVVNDPVNWIDPIGLIPITNNTSKPIHASGNRGLLTGTGEQVTITIQPGETVDIFHPKNGVRDVDQIEGKKIPGASFGNPNQIIEKDGELTIREIPNSPNFSDPKDTPLKDFPDFPPDQLPKDWPKPGSDPCLQ